MLRRRELISPQRKLAGSRDQLMQSRAMLSRRGLLLSRIPIVAAGNLSAFQWGELATTLALTASGWVVAALLWLTVDVEAVVPDRRTSSVVA